MRKKDHTGRTFGKLTAIRRISENGRTKYECQCECGNIIIRKQNNLVSGNTKSCGCLNKEANKYRALSRRLPNGLAHARVVVYTYKRNAKNRKLSFELTEAECIKLFKQKCYYCGRKPFNIIKRKERIGEFICNGIDRIDNNLGYTQENCVPCCKECNHAKNNLNKDHFVKLVELIYKNLKKKEVAA